MNRVPRAANSSAMGKVCLPFKLTSSSAMSNAGPFVACLRASSYLATVPTTVQPRSCSMSSNSMDSIDSSSTTRILSPFTSMTLAGDAGVCCCAIIFHRPQSTVRGSSTTPALGTGVDDQALIRISQPSAPASECPGAPVGVAARLSAIASEVSSLTCALLGLAVPTRLPAEARQEGSRSRVIPGPGAADFPRAGPNDLLDVLTCHNFDPLRKVPRPIFRSLPSRGTAAGDFAIKGSAAPANEQDRPNCQSWLFAAKGRLGLGAAGRLPGPSWRNSRAGADPGKTDSARGGAQWVREQPLVPAASCALKFRESPWGSAFAIALPVSDVRAASLRRWRASSHPTRSSARQPTTFASVTMAPNSRSGSALAAAQACFTPKRGANTPSSASPSVPSPIQVFRHPKMLFMTVADIPGFGSRRVQKPTTRTLVLPRRRPAASLPETSSDQRRDVERSWHLGARWPSRGFGPTGRA